MGKLDLWDDIRLWFIWMIMNLRVVLCERFLKSFNFGFQITVQILGQWRQVATTSWNAFTFIMQTTKTRKLQKLRTAVGIETTTSYSQDGCFFTSKLRNGLNVSLTCWPRIESDFHHNTWFSSMRNLPDGIRWAPHTNTVGGDAPEKIPCFWGVAPNFWSVLYFVEWINDYSKNDWY